MASTTSSSDVCASNSEPRNLPVGQASAVWGLALGGGVSFGVGYSIGVIKTYVKPPQVNWPTSLIAQLHGAMYNSRAG